MSGDAVPARRVSAAEVREFGGVLLVLAGCAALLAVLVVEATAGEWGRVALVAAAVVLLAAGRWLARYDPRMVAVRRAQRAERAQARARAAAPVGG